MMGLTDRVEPWARRFQRAPEQRAGEHERLEIEEPDPRRNDRFVRRSDPPARPAPRTGRRAAGTTRG